MEFLQSLLDNSSIPIVTAFLLGILTAISPCPLATNITAIGYISKDIANKNNIFRNGLLYTLGRVLTYSILGFIIIPLLRQGAALFSLQKTLAYVGDILVGPVLIISGIFMLWGDRLHLPKFGLTNLDRDRLKPKGGWGALLLGILFSLAFCPTSGVFYFGILMPLAASKSEGLLLPIIFAIATAFPVIITAWILAYSFAGIGKFYNRIQHIQHWLSTIVAVLFLLIGCYYIIRYYL